MLLEQFLRGGMLDGAGDSATRVHSRADLVAELGLMRLVGCWVSLSQGLLRVRLAPLGGGGP
jgi:hypothetical protein